MSNRFHPAARSTSPEQKISRNLVAAGAPAQPSARFARRAVASGLRLQSLRFARESIVGMLLDGVPLSVVAETVTDVEARGREWDRQAKKIGNALLRVWAQALDALVRRTLIRFAKDLSAGTWHGREREAISLYAFGYLVRSCTPGGVLADPSQIGIEVAVKQLPGRGKRGVRKDQRVVCKDLVLWRNPRETCWDQKRRVVNRPMAVLLWKVSKSGWENDIAWLREFSVKCRGVTGYAIDLKLRPTIRLKCAIVRSGYINAEWLTLSAKSP